MRRHSRHNHLSHGVSAKQFWNLLLYLGLSGRRTLIRVLVGRTSFGINSETGRYDRSNFVSFLRRHQNAVKAYESKRSMAAPYLENPGPSHAPRKRRHAPGGPAGGPSIEEVGDDADTEQREGQNPRKRFCQDTVEERLTEIRGTSPPRQEEETASPVDERVELGLVPVGHRSASSASPGQQKTVKLSGLLKNDLVAPHAYHLKFGDFVRHGGQVYLNMSERAAAQYIRVRVLDFVHKFFPTPVEGLRHLAAWHEDNELVQIPEKHPAVADALGQYRRGLCHKTLAEIKSMLMAETATPVFAAPDGDVVRHYHSLENSVKILDMLLLYQYRDAKSVSAFLTRVYHLLDKIDPKKNCMTISGPPNCGKTYFGNVLQGIMLSVGVVENCNRYHSFPFQTCIDKRLLFWDEPQLPSADSLEDLKLLFGGYALNANVKYRNAQLIKRTPVLIMTNNQQFPSSAVVWSTRIMRERWRTCPKLIKASKQAHPMALFHLFDKYEVDITRSLIPQEESEIELSGDEEGPSGTLDSFVITTPSTSQ